MSAQIVLTWDLQMSLLCVGSQNTETLYRAY